MPISVSDPFPFDQDPRIYFMNNINGSGSRSDLKSRNINIKYNASFFLFVISELIIYV